jgi:peptidoglycan/xylan/chitin deacetylase (PgdA/CDA1 family)
VQEIAPPPDQRLFINAPSAAAQIKAAGFYLALAQQTEGAIPPFPMKDFLKDCISFIFYLASFLFPPRGEVVLVYHSVGDIVPQNDPYKMNVSPGLFQKQMRLASRIKDRKISVTFDDGFGSIFRHAIPVVLRYNIKPIVFLTTGFLDKQMDFSHLFKGGVNPRALSWEEVRSLAEAGVEMGAHGINHANLARLNRQAALDEIQGSKQRIEEETHRPVNYFAYPFGPRSSFSDETKGLVRESGFLMAYTNIMGFNHDKSDPYALRRIRIYSNDNGLRFRMKLRGAYNWVDNYVK